MTDTRLKNCPFCGSEAEIRTNFVHHFAICKECNTVSDYMNSKAEAIAAWNRRSAPAVPDGWVMVPRRPDENMKSAVRDIAGPEALAYALAGWNTFISAAPAAPTEDE